MSVWKIALTALIAIFSINCFAQFGQTQEKPKTGKVRPLVEVVFCLDTTGSMGGLIATAKEKIWAISNQIAGGKPTPQLKVGLVAYRDRGDDYRTRLFPLTEDLDAIHAHLNKFQAKGGGDFPESVNQALHEAVTKMNWSKNKTALRIIFLVGDAPPKMTYKDDVKYPLSCKLANKKGILINSIQCGTHAKTKDAWKTISTLGRGSYVQINAQGGPLQFLATPFDEELAKINREMAKDTLPYGNRHTQKAAEEKTKAAMNLPIGPAASRAGFNSKVGQVATYDLLDNIRRGKVRLENLRRDELPPQLQNLSLKDQKAFLKRLEEKRLHLQKKAIKLDQKRHLFLQKKLEDLKEFKAPESFEQQVLRILQQQATRAKIRYSEVKPAKK